MKIWTIVALALTFSLFNCGGSGDTADTDSQTAAEETPPAPSEAAPASADGTVELQLSGNDQMKFDKDELKVPAGSTVRLTLKHTGEMAKEVMGHNFVLLKQGVDPMAYGAKAVEAGLDNNHIPEGGDEIAYTEMIGGGESTTVTFEAPEAGTYDFVCSFPGHVALMKGKFIVE